MKAKTCQIVFLLLFVTASAMSQGLKPPTEGKAVIYFVRVSAMGALIPFDFFHEKKYIGQFAGRNYMRYECDAGEHLFWASSENKEFLTAEVKAGETYIVIVDVEMGIGIARVGLTPIDAQHKVFERAKKLIENKAPKQEADAQIEKENVRLATFIDEKLQKYHDSWKTEKKFGHLSSDMAIPGTAF